MSAPEPSESSPQLTAALEAQADSSILGSTGAAPTCPMPLAADAPANGAIPWLARGTVIDDYEIIRQLGAGAFARVYLARQISLDRQVALKVSRNVGSEARVLARLEHQHIVQIFAEFIEPTRNLRLLCMQLVPGVTLAQLIQKLRERPPDTWSGAAFLSTLDELCTEPATFDLAGFSCRAFIEAGTHVELACWLGARLAEALAHAHSQGVIHRDVKPANILVNRYGRPFLADFNIALNTQSGEGIFGGTLSYMAPEHLEALLAGAPAAQSAVDARADLYSLAVVLFEIVSGRTPFSRGSAVGRAETMRQLIAERRAAGAPSLREIQPDTPALLDRLLRRCLDPAPANRFASAEAFARAVEGCSALLRADKMADSATFSPLPLGEGPGVRDSASLSGIEGDQPSRLVRWCRSSPYLMIVVFGVVPNLIGSVVNIVFNSLLIVDKDPRQKACFLSLTLAYNLVIYPLTVGAAVALLCRSHREWRRLTADPMLPPAAAAQTRRHALALPAWILVLCCVGWFPGGLVFPVGLHLCAGPLALSDSIAFLLSFLISGLIASTYAYFGAQFVVLRALYPGMWSDPSSAEHLARRELAPISSRLRWQQMLAVLIPLLGAGLLIGAGPDQLTLTFRLLVTSLIVLGLAGFALATHICHRLSTLLALLTGAAAGLSGERRLPNDADRAI